jgi:hypothetical protein
MKLAIVNEAARQRAQLALASVPHGTTVSFKPPGRTVSQNDRMWATLTRISDARPDGREATPETWKALFMSAMGHEARFEMGLDGRPFPVGFSSSHLTRAQMADLLTFIEAWAAERGIDTGEDA